MNKIILSLALALSLATGPLWAETHRISILPRFFPDKLTAMMTPLLAYLRDQTGLELELVLMKDFQEYEKRLQAGEIAMGFQNPLVYTRVASRHEAVAMAREQGEDRFRGIVIARPDNPIQQLADLKGKRVMMVGETSAGGYLSQKLSLMEIGIPMDQLTLDTAADNRQENVIISVSIGDVDAGFIRESALHVADQYIAPGSIRQVTETAWLPGWALSLDRDLPQEARSKLVDALLKLQAGAPELKALEVDGFVPATDADYQPIRRALGQP